MASAAGTPLATPIDGMRPHYPVVVVGSGYGGAIAASRLARAGQQVCLLERGREFRPGEYPNTLAEAAAQFQVTGPEGHVGSPTGLYDLRLNQGMSVFMGCGLGGTSLVNANVSLRADQRVFQDPRWPAELREDAAALDGAHERAIEMLRPTPYPDHEAPLSKLAALETSAGRAGGRFYRPPINVTFTDGVNHVGVMQHKCELCGDCVSGCNYGAKNTLLMNYLPDAVNHGAEVFTGTAVRSVERRDHRWVVHYQLLDAGRDVFHAPELFVTADVVVLSAGTLGSTEILLRSRDRGLAISDRIGRRFTGNGDVLAFGYNAERRIDGIGHGARSRDPVGPCITGIIDLREQPELETGMVIEEGSIPGAIGAYLPHAFTAMNHYGVNTVSGLRPVLRQRERELESLVRGPYSGAVRNTQIYLVMTHDRDAGRIVLDDDRAIVEWERVGYEKIFRLVDERLRSATAAIEGIHVRDPLWLGVLGKSLVTVHPLGGCVMGDDAGVAVVDHCHRVFSATSGHEVHEGLYVADGSVIPRPVGVNPLLTISALAERAMWLMARDRGWTIDYSLPSAPPPGVAPPAPRTVGIEFTERMAGWFSTEPGEDYLAAAERGKREGCELAFTLTIATPDVERMVRDPEHAARMAGTVVAPRLSPEPLAVDEGDFNLFLDDPDDPHVRRMRYRMRLTAEDGATYFFEGFKLMQDANWLSMWPETTTLYVTLHAGADDAASVLGKGVLWIAPADFARQLRTMRALHATSAKEGVEAVARFGSYFAGVLFHTYGGIHLGAEPRKRRDLRLPVPEAHAVETADGSRLLLTRHPGGDRCPVLLVPGAGVAGLFTRDTIDTNLVEFLWLSGHEVWVLDWRDTAGEPVEGYRAALDHVRQATGEASVAVVGHGPGAAGLLRAILAGVPGVHAAVCSGRGLDGAEGDLDRLALPLAFVAGAADEAGVAGTRETFELLRQRNGPDRYARLVLRGGGADDPVAGPDAVRDVYPWLVAHLEA